MKIKALISFAATPKLICVFVFAYAKSQFSHDAAHIILILIRLWRSWGKKHLTGPLLNFSDSVHCKGGTLWHCVHPVKSIQSQILSLIRLNGMNFLGCQISLSNLSRIMRKSVLSSVFTTRSDTNQAVPQQKIARGLKCQI